MTGAETTDEYLLMNNNNFKLYFISLLHYSNFLSSLPYWEPEQWC